MPPSGRRTIASMLASRPKDSPTDFQTVQNEWYRAEFKDSIQLPCEYDPPTLGFPSSDRWKFSIPHLYGDARLKR